jgi:DNA-binding GntR family transcriptional regulator
MSATPASSDTPPARGSRLQRDAAARIRALLFQRESAAGTHLPELELSRELKISRTPVRAALLLLADEGIVEFHPGRGFFLKHRLQESDRGPPAAGDDEIEALSVALARDRMRGQLENDVSESDLMRRYGVTRALLTRVLRQLAEAGMAERNRGHGWKFLPALSDDGTGSEDSYRFRMIVEPAGLLEPGFNPDPAWLRSIRVRHEHMLRPGSKFSPVTFFEMNAEFHEGLARASGNNFLHMAVVQQNKLRRFLNYDWTYGPGRVEVSVRDHLAILNALESGEREWAATLLRRHIQTSGGLQPDR